MTMTISRQTTPMILIFKTRFEPCRWKVCAEVGPFCRKGLRSIAATCDQTCFDGKTMSAEITAPLFVSRCEVPLTVRLAAKVLSGRKDLQKSPKHIAVKLLFRYATGRRSTLNLTQRPPSALAKSKPGIFQNLVFVAQLQFCLRQLQRRRSHRMAVL